MTSVLTGKRILVVEDEVIVSMMLEDMLNELGATVVGPARTLSEALAMATTERIDAAVLDVNLRGERIDAVAEVLQRRGIRFLFATGYGQRIGVAAGAPVIDKPYTKDALARALAGCLAPLG